MGEGKRERERVNEIRTSDSIDLTAGHLERRLKRQVLRLVCAFLLMRVVGEFFLGEMFFDCWV